MAGEVVYDNFQLNESPHICVKGELGQTLPINNFKLIGFMHKSAIQTS